MDSYNNILKDTKRYLAHLPKTNEQKKAETLLEHSELVINYTKRLCKEFRLQETINTLIANSVHSDVSSGLKRQVLDFFFDSIYFHDLGKINPNFQLKKMENSRFKQKQLEFGSDHSYPGALMYIDINLTSIIENKTLNQNEKLTAIIFLFLFSFQITKHHSPFLSAAIQHIYKRLNFSDEEEKINLKQVQSLLKELEGIESSKYWELISKYDEKTNNSWIKLQVKRYFETNEKQKISPFPLFALLKLHYSLLTASDYLATTHYMNNWNSPLQDFGTISNELRKRIVKNVRTTKEYNKTVFEVLNNYQFTYPTYSSNKNLNRLRQELSVEVIQNIRSNKDKKVFYIEAPTGGGKTNLSMLAAAELLEQNQGISNLYYVFPFTTLITQTFDAVKETMGLDEDEIIQLHSKEGFKEKTEGEYGQEKKSYIDYLFLNYPVALMSHVKFFDILKTNGKESNYLLHRLANSVVVIDELQSYPPKIWDKLIYIIQNYANYFNIRFILMSATLPKLDKLSNVARDICYLTKNKEQFFPNPNFCNRVEFDFSLLEWAVPEKEEKADYLNRLGEFVVEKSKNYAQGNDKYPDSVFTIIEFIYKQTATEFYSVIKQLADGFFDEIFVLSGTILESRRKEIIHYLKNPKNRDKKIIVITTQVVEAGVDIDMDLGFKDKSLVDSDEQLAGRINRNVNKPACKLFLFNCDNAEVLYKGDDRFVLLQNELSEMGNQILKSKDFDKLYDEVMRKIDKKNKRVFQQGFTNFQENIKMLNFPEVDRDFRIINQQNTSVFVPINIDVFVPGTKDAERNFSEKEINFLSKYNIVLPSDTQVSGKKVFDLYEQLIKQENCDFIAAKTEIKRLQGIMSKFIFSLMTQSKSLEKLIAEVRGEMRMGMYYLSHWEEDKIYNYKFGLIEKNEPAILL